VKGPRGRERVGEGQPLGRDEHPRAVAELDSSFSAETILAGTGRHHFTGAMIGLYATGGGARATVPADVEWFEYSPSRPVRRGRARKTGRLLDIIYRLP
jgi:Beta xylosidase C-terminal Concanavalin A-like domain